MKGNRKVFKSFWKIWKRKIVIFDLSAKAILGFEVVKTTLFALLTWGMWCPL